jgi:hypothetical protein
MRGILAIWSAFVLAGCASYESRVRGLQPSPAHWVDKEDGFAPVWGDFTFDALSFSTPADGWVVGDRFLLHLMGEDVTVTFTRPTHAWLDSVTFISPERGWAAGSRQSSGVVWQYLGGRWEPSDLNAVAWPEWSVHAVWASPRDDAWAAATAQVKGDDRHPPAPKRFKPLLLHWEGVDWRVDESPRKEGRRWMFTSACFDPLGDAWFVGADFADPNVMQPLVVRRQRGAMGTGTIARVRRCANGTRRGHLPPRWSRDRLGEHRAGGQPTRPTISIAIQRRVGACGRTARIPAIRGRCDGGLVGVRCLARSDQRRCTCWGSSDISPLDQWPVDRGSRSAAALGGVAVDTASPTCSSCRPPRDGRLQMITTGRTSSVV